MDAPKTLRATYRGPYHANYHVYLCEAGDTMYLNHLPAGVEPGNYVTLRYVVNRGVSGLWYAEAVT